MEINRTTVFAAVGTVSVAVLGYCVYFDYRRRHDVEFRRAIKREHKRLAGIEREKQRRAEVGEEEAVLEALRQAKATPLATSAEDREQAFMQEVARGEQLYAEGESQKYEAAICFWRALKMYPQPAELTRIYEQTIPPVSFPHPDLYLNWSLTCFHHHNSSSSRLCSRWWSSRARSRQSRSTRWSSRCRLHLPLSSTSSNQHPYIAIAHLTQSQL